MRCMKNPSGLVMLTRMNRAHPKPSRIDRGLAQGVCLTASLLTACLLLSACGSMRSSVIVEPAPGVTYTGQGVTQTSRTKVPGGSYRVARGDTLYSIAFRNGVDFRDLAQWNGIAAPYTIWPGQLLSLSADGKTTRSHPAGGAAGGVTRVVPPSPAPAAASATSAASLPAAPVFAPVPPPRPPVTKPSQATVPAVGASTAVVVPVAGAPAGVAVGMRPPVAPSALPAGASRQMGGVNWRWPAQGTLLKGYQGGEAVPGIEIGGNPGDPVRAAADGVVVYSGNGLVGYGELVIIKHNDTFLSAYGHNRKRLVKEGQRVTAGQPIAEMGSTGASRTELEFQIRKDGNPVDPLSYLPPR
jgi:lipoprotein NlpD